jgi:hypothetical protein
LIVGFSCFISVQGFTSSAAQLAAGDDAGSCSSSSFDGDIADFCEEETKGF